MSTELASAATQPKYTITRTILNRFTGAVQFTAELSCPVDELLSFKLGWFPSGGASSPGEAYTSNWQRIFSLDYLQHLALPVITLALYLQGLPLLLMRSNML